MKHSLLTKYNVAVPRYTSYPPANFFNGHFTEAQLLQAVEESNSQGAASISLYIHFPYCQRLCYYCGCNSHLLQSKAEMERYMEALRREMTMVFEHLDKSRQVSQIHWGGGSPSILPTHYLKELNAYIRNTFSTTNEVEIAIECHPGYLHRQGWLELIEAGFNRISIGVQDINREVLKGTNRKPSLMELSEICQLLRAHGVAINLDFIFGLPHQTVETMTQAMECAVALQPDRVVTFSYAHVPWVNRAMLRLEAKGLPTQEQKEALFGTIQRILLQNGYKAIGIDHFVKPTDALYTALQVGTLHRNFQGYCTRNTTGQVYAFGVSAISQLHTAYAQNTKVIADYLTAIESGNIPVAKGYLLSTQEQLIRDAIASIMCNQTLWWSDLAHKYNRSITAIQEALAVPWSTLQQMESDGLLELTSEGVRVAPLGVPFCRNIAATFDPLVNNNATQQFSKPW